MICKRVRVRDWRNIQNVVTICSGETKVTSESKPYPTSTKCKFATDKAGIRMNNNGEIQVFYRDRCSSKEATGKWVKRGYSSARHDTDSVLAHVIVPHPHVAKCRKVTAKDFKGKHKKVRVCPGQTIWTKKGKKHDKTDKCPFARTKSGVEMNDKGEVRAVLRHRCSKLTFNGPFIYSVGDSVAKFAKKEALVRVPLSKREQRKVECGPLVRRAYIQVLSRSVDPVSYQDYLQRCIKKECDWSCMIKELKETDEYKEIQKKLKAQKLPAGHRIQSGDLWWGMWDGAWRLLNGNGQRTSCKTIKFRKPFGKPPRVQVMMNSLDMVRASNYYRIYVLPQNIKTDGFDACFTSWVDSRIWSVSINWVAISRSVKGVELGIASSQSGDNHPLMHAGREATDVTLKKQIKNPDIFMGFQHLDLWRGANQRMNTYVTDEKTGAFRVHFDTWADSKCWQVKNSYVAMDVKKLQKQGLNVEVGSFVPTGAIQPRLWNYNQPSERVYNHCMRFSKPFSKPPAVVIGFINLDTANSNNIRAATRIYEITKTGMCVRFWTWWTSHVWSMGLSYMAYSSE